MALYRTEREVIQRVTDMRDALSGLRTRMACDVALGVAYSNGKQWTKARYDSQNGTTDRVWLNEDWNPRSTDIRVVDNRIGMLVRRAAAETNAVRIEASVQPGRHMRNTENARVASVAQDTLNSLDEWCGQTRCARDSSYRRWLAGSHLIHVVRCQKVNYPTGEIATYQDGSPIEVGDQWIRWISTPIVELLWDSYNISDDLWDHTTLALEQVMSLRRFEQIYGPVEAFGFDEKNLPKMGDLAPYTKAAAQFNADLFYSSSGFSNEQPGLRVITLIESDPRDPTIWPEQYLIVDTSQTFGTGTTISGRVVNIENPRTPHGYHGRSLFKLDAFKTKQSVWSIGIPHVAMGNQDLLNLTRSLQVQQLAQMHGYWSIDKASTKREDFEKQLMMGYGAIVEWDSNRQNSKEPKWVQAGHVSTEMVAMSADFSQSMDSKVHISPMQRGFGKSHVPQDVALALLQEGGAVMDGIVQADASVYGEALKLTLGTFRRTAEQPNRMLARLRDRHGFTYSDLQTLMRIDAANIPYEVTVRQSSIISRSIDERMAQLQTDLQLGVISPHDYVLETVDGVERPATRAQEAAVNQMKQAVEQIQLGAPFFGYPSWDFGLFLAVARRAMDGIDLLEPGGQMKRAFVELAVEKQRQIAEALAERGWGAAVETAKTMGGQQPGAATLSGLPPASQGAPESINPTTSPVGASGGLPLGLGSEAG